MLSRTNPRSARRIAGSASALALATALAAGPAHGQSATSYNAPDPTIVSGSVNFDRGNVSGVETYNINSPTAVIDFTPFDTATGGPPINFQDAGTSVTYQGISNFTVLNRIVPADPARAIQFNGTVNSLVGSVTGGSVWFYSPGGIVLGSGAVFDVGSLLLATGDPTGGSGTIGSTTSFSIASAADTNYAITVQPGAQIKATPEGSYVALVAPVVNQNGSVRVNGAAAYVAAEQANLTINQGLFDIDVVVGSNGGGTPLTHKGDSGGPSSTGAGDNHGIYMVAVPKNSAITMLVAPNGQLGFDTAASATIENGAIYLRTADITGIVPTRPIGSRLSGPTGLALTAPAPANILYQPTNGAGLHTLTSNLEAQAVNQLDIDLTGDNLAPVQTSWYAGDRTTMTLRAGSTLDATQFALVAYNATKGGDVAFNALPGSVANFAEHIGLGSSGIALFTQHGLGNSVRPNTGGSAIMTVQGASVTTNGLSGVGLAGHTLLLRAPTGDGSGIARLQVQQGGQVTAKINGTTAALRVSASPTVAPPAGLPRKGGVASVTLDNGSIFSDNIFIDAPGFGTAADVAGGTAEIVTFAGGGSLDSKIITINAGSTADTPVPTSSSTGGTARLILNDTTGATTINAVTLSLLANGTAAASTGSASAPGGAGAGGTAQILVGSNASLTVATLLEVKATATGGMGVLGGDGGAATAGKAEVTANGGAISFNNALLTVEAIGGAGALGASPTIAAGVGGAGLVGAGVSLNASKASNIVGKNLTMTASADGGVGGSGAGGTGLAGSGGAATGSPISVNASDSGQIKVTTVTADARGTGGSSGFGASTSATKGGAGKGGALTIGVGPGLIEMFDLDAALDGFSGSGFANGSDAGDAIGGSASIFTLAGGTFRVTSGETSISTTAAGGNNNGGGDLIGGNATAGNIAIGGFGAVEILGTDLSLDASAFGGDFLPASAGGAGGKAVAGFIDLNTPGTLVVTGPTIGFATAIGGDTASLSGGAGGVGLGGKFFVTAAKGAGSFTGNVSVEAAARGGTGAGSSAGGAAVGGRARIGTDAFSGTGIGPSTLTFANSVIMTTDGTGGNSATGTGGAGYAGQAPIPGLTTQEAGIEIHTLGGAITLNKAVSLQSRGLGGTGGTGGLGQGGRANLISFGGNLKAQQTVFGTVAGTGGSGSTGIGGEGIGGTFAIQTQDGGFGVPVGTVASVTVADVTASGDGRGGLGQAGGGVGRGGSAFIQALAAQNSISVSGPITMTVLGSGGNYTGSGTGAGGLGQGGSASLSAKAGTLVMAQSVNVRADAFGGAANSASQGTGGSGIAGNVFYFADAGSVTQTGGDILLSAEGIGGFGGPVGAGGSGGQGIGGRTSLDAFNGGTIDSSATSVSLDASGDGGSVSGGNGSGGLGQGGNARILANNIGTIILRSDVDVIADGGGGSASGTGNGGNGIGGEARLSTAGGQAANAITITGSLSLDASAFGGFSPQGKGGDAFGGTPADVNAGPFDKGSYLVATGGQIAVGGNVLMDAYGVGGGGGLSGGVGTGGLANMVAFGAAISLPGIVSLDSSGQGGSGSSGSGGAGGNAIGGLSVISASSGGDSQGGGVVPLGAPSSVTLGQTIIDASGEAGEGGSGAIGAAGGLGGDGTGGVVRAIAQAGSGQLKTGQLLAFLQGVGGSGGDGGAAASPSSSGGAGGKGGVGTGGFTNFGTVSGPDTSGNNGSATFADVSFFLDGIGGTGGNGTDGGRGGDGGLGVGGDGALLSRGAPVVATTIAIDASGFGGPTGEGSGATPVAGAQGEGRGGSAGMLITNRFNRTERGSLSAASFIGTATGLGGSNGISFGPSVSGQVFAQVSKSDTTLDDLSLTASGSSPAPAGFESYIKVDNGLLQATSIGLSTIGDLQFSVVDNGILRAEFLSLNATGSLLPATAGAPGLVEVESDLTASFGLDFITDSSFDIGGSFTGSASRNLKIGDVRADGDIQLFGGDSVEAGTLIAGDRIQVFTSGGIQTGDMTAGLNNDSATFGDIELSGYGSVDVGNLIGATIYVEANTQNNNPGSNLTTGTLTAETITLDVTGAIVTGDIKTSDLYAGIDTGIDNYLIGIGSVSDVKLGNVDAFTSVAVGSVQGKVETGAIKANDSVMLLAATSVSTGGIATGTDAKDSVFVSNASIIESNPDFAALQDFAFIGQTFDIDVLATATPVRTGGAITLGGPISTVNFAAATAQSFQSGDIAAPARLFLDVGGSITGGALSTAGVLTLKSDQDINLGSLTAATISVTSGQNVTAGTIAATGAVNITATRFAFFQGQVTAPTIDVTSGDIAIGQGGGLGGNGTTRLTLTATGGGPRFGGTIGDTQYSLDSREVQTLRAQLIELRSNSTALVGEMSLQGSLNGDSANLIGQNGRMTISSNSGMQVVGQVTVNNAASTNRLTLNAGEGLDIATDQGGGIAMFGSTSAALGGTLSLNSGSVRVATSSLLGQLGALPSAQRASALRTAPNGRLRPEGYLQANRIEFVTNQLYIQNSNTASQFGGFSAGPGGALLASRAGSSTPVEAIIYGRIADSSGTFKINQDAVSLLTLGSGEGGPTTVASGSTFNDCPFTGSCGDVQPPPPEEEEEEEIELIIDRIPAVVAAAIAGAMASTTDPESVAALPTVNLVTTIDTGPLRTDPVVSDPVTGGGNSGLWDSPEDEEREENRPAPGGDGQ